jgi:hypothetical protein
MSTYQSHQSHQPHQPQTNQPDEDEVAAALAAIGHYLAAEATGQERDWEAEDQPQWRTSAILVAQGIPVVRAAQRPTWSNIERLRRVGHGGTGIVGL